MCLLLSSEVGDEFRSDKHEVVGLVDGDSDVSTIVQVIRQGVLDSEGLVLRCAIFSKYPLHDHSFYPTFFE